jgi:hypothetical protein
MWKVTSYGLKLDWRGFLVAAGASVMATPFSELPAVLVQQGDRGLDEIRIG